MALLELGKEQQATKYNIYNVSVVEEKERKDSEKYHFEQPSKKGYGDPPNNTAKI